jgi:hypothetical protein
VGPYGSRLRERGIKMEHDRLRRYTAGICLVLSPAAGFAAWLVHPGLEREEIDQLTAIGGATVRTDVANLLGLASIVLGVFAVMGLAHLLHESKSPAGYVGAGIATLGLVTVAGSIGTQAAAVELARTGFLTENVAILEALTTGPVAIATMVGGIALALGLLVLAIELFRAHVIPEPSAVLLGIFGITQAVGFIVFSAPVVIAAFAAGLIGLAPVGIRLITESDSEWEHAPRMHWYHPIGT